MLKQSNLLHIATIGKSVGIKGDMKLHLNTDFPQQFKKNCSFFINSQDKITLSDVNLGRGLIKIEGITTPEDAKKFTNKKLYTTIEDTRKNCKLGDDEYFWFDIIGCIVKEGDEILGEVVEIDRINNLNYLKIKTDEKLIKDGFAKSFLLPRVAPLVIKTDIEAKEIIADGAKDILEAS